MIRARFCFFFAEAAKAAELCNRCSLSHSPLKDLRMVCLLEAPGDIDFCSLVDSCTILTTTVLRTWNLW